MSKPAHAGRSLSTLMGLLLASLFAPLVAVIAAPAQTPVSERVVDSLTLRQGGQLVGAALGQQSDGALVFAVERSWLSQTSPSLLVKFRREELVESKKAWGQLIERIPKWIEARSEDKELVNFLESELERIRRIADKVEDESDADLPQFILARLPRQSIERTFLQKPERKQIAVLAWEERLHDVSLRSKDSLVRELEKRKIDLQSAPAADLSDRVSALSQDDLEWAVRQALVEHQFGKRLEFQGTPDFVVRTDEAKPQLDLTKMLSETLQSQIGDLLEPAPKNNKAAGRLQEAKWFATATRTATESDIKGFRVTLVAQDLAARKVQVASHFVVQLPDNSWRTAWTSNLTEDASQARPEAEARIARDPQITQALGLVKSLGLPGADEQVQQSIRFGAAVLEAQQRANGDFMKFLSRHTWTLDRPVIILPQ